MPTFDRSTKEGSAAYMKDYRQRERGHLPAGWIRIKCKDGLNRVMDKQQCLRCGKCSMKEGIAAYKKDRRRRMKDSRWRTKHHIKKDGCLQLGWVRVKCKDGQIRIKKPRKEYLKKYVARPESILARQKRYEENKDLIQEQQRVWRNKPLNKASRAVYINQRRTQENLGDLTTEEWLEIKNKSPMCPMCGRFVECENLVLEHIIPLVLAMRNGPFFGLKLHTKNNIQALCMKCNLKKGTHLPNIPIDQMLHTLTQA